MAAEIQTLDGLGTTTNTSGGASVFNVYDAANELVFTYTAPMSQPLQGTNSVYSNILSDIEDINNLSWNITGTAILTNVFLGTSVANLPADPPRSDNRFTNGNVIWITPSENFLNFALDDYLGKSIYNGFNNIVGSQAWTIGGASGTFHPTPTLQAAAVHNPSQGVRRPSEAVGLPNVYTISLTSGGTAWNSSNKIVVGDSLSVTLTTGIKYTFTYPEDTPVTGFFRIEADHSAGTGGDIRFGNANSNNQGAQPPTDVGDMIVASGDTSTINLPTGSNQDIQGILSGNGTITKTGGGRLTLSGENTFTGTLNIQDGTVDTTNTGTGFSPSLNLSSGATYAINNNHTVSEILGNGTLDIASNRSLTLNGVNDHISNNAISGTGNLIKNNANTITLRGNSNYSGNTMINGGCLTMTNLSSMGARPVTTRTDWLQLNNNSCLLVDLTDTNNRFLELESTAGTTISGNAEIRVRNGSFSKLGIISGTNSNLTINSDDNNVNTLRLRGQNNYGGTTTVNKNMVLDLDALSTTGSVLTSNIIVNGQLRGKGRITGDITINGGAIFSPGTMPGDTLNIDGTLILNNGSETYVELTDSTSDKIIMGTNNNITLNGLLYLIPFSNINTNFSSNLITLNGGIRTGEFGSMIMMPTDNNINNGLDDIPTDQYPTINYNATTVTLTR